MKLYSLIKTTGQEQSIAHGNRRQELQIENIVCLGDGTGSSGHRSQVTGSRPGQLPISH